MADYDSSLPIRTETDADVGAAIFDATGTNAWNIDANNIGHVNLDDGTNALVIGPNGEITVIMTDGTDTVAIDGSGNLSTLITDGTDVLAINTDGSINVNIIDAVQGGEVHEYALSAAVAAGATVDVVSYTVTAATTLILRGWQASSSGKAKAVLSVGPATTEVDQAVRFISTSNGGFNEALPEAIEVVAGDKVLVTMTNNEPGQAVDLYAWINGREVA